MSSQPTDQVTQAEAPTPTPTNATAAEDNAPTTNQPAVNQPTANRPASSGNWASATDSLAWTQGQAPTNQPIANQPIANQPIANQPIANQPIAPASALPGTYGQPAAAATPTIGSASGWNAPSQAAPGFSSAAYAPYTPYAPYPAQAPQPSVNPPYAAYAPYAPPAEGRPPIRTSGPLPAPGGQPATATLTGTPPQGPRTRSAVGGDAYGRRGPILAIGAAALIALLVVALLAFALGRVSGGATSTGPSTTPGPTITTAPSSATVNANTTSAKALQQAIVNIVKTVQPSVVEITSVSSQAEAIGSGDILQSNGYIVTNDHVVSGFTSYTVTLSNGKQYAAQLVGADAQDDLAVLKINATGLTPLPIADASAVQVGDFAIAVGSPLGLQNTNTFGIVSALNRSENEGTGGVTGTLTGLTQTSAPINPGNSGGALVNLDGQLIGIPTLGASTDSSGTTVSGIGFAIPSSRVVYVVNQLIASGKLTHTNQGFLGVQGQSVTPQSGAAQGGVQVAGFANDATGQSPAQQGGVQAGDIITAVNGQPITSQTDLAGAVFDQTPGAKITLTVLRNSATTTLTVTLGERPVGA